ncbi:MAG: HEAT repeat domain-containing protein [Planctomycetes bacterium]|nr:HEAT repeat domain-containing protein [Planctomycetota bacterium]
MKTLGLLLSCSIAFSLVSVQPCFAHGGQYRGPLDIVPPGGSGPRTPGPAGPVTPGPSGPKAPGPSGPGPGAGPVTGGGGSGPGGTGPQAGRTGGRGIPVDEDLSRWEFWWEFNKDPYLRLKDAVHLGGPRTGEEESWLGTGLRHDRASSTLKPTDAQIVDEVLPALKKALDDTRQRDITTSCLIAMAKIGQNHPSFRLLDAFQPRLRRDDQEVRETAALAIGIAGIAEEREVSLLMSLVADDAAGRAACDRAEVDERTRSFAAYGLGLLANRTANLDLKGKVLAGLRPLLDAPNAGSRNLQVAVIQAIGLLSIDANAPGGNQLLETAVQCLQRFYEAKLGVGQQLIQAHCPTAIAKLVFGHPVLAAAWKQRFAAELRGEDAKRTSRDLARSCVIALGKLCGPDGEGPDAAFPDRAYSQLLRDTYHQHSDDQTRYFAAMALAEIGGKNNRDALLSMLRKGKKALEKPWCAIALGVYAFRDLAAREVGGVSAEPDSTIGNDLMAEFTNSKVPGVRAALAIGLGLCRWTASSERLRECLKEESRQDELAGYVCIGLALMNERRATDDIQAIVEMSGRRPDLLKQAAIALGKLGDKTAADHLQQLLADSESNLARLAGLATALGFIGDQRSIAPLTKMLFDSSLGDLSRAFAAVALGGIADKEMLPWNSKIAVGSNYRAAVETLTDRATGILDIL